MTLFLLCMWILWFMLYFYAIGMWYIGFLPLIFLGILFAYYGTHEGIKATSTSLLQEYSLLIARWVILCGILGIGNFFGIDLISLCLILLALNLCLWIISYLVAYTDGKTVFKRGYYAVAVFLLISMTVFEWRNWLLSTFSLLRIFHLWICGFFVGVVQLKTDVLDDFFPLLAILLLGSFGIFFLHQLPNTYIALALFWALLTGAYTWIRIYSQYVPAQQARATVSVRRILAGERITDQKKYLHSPFTKVLVHMLTQFPDYAKRMLELMNIFLIFALMYHYLGHIALFGSINHVFYRVVIALFINNVFLLKKLGYNSIIQNLIIFLVINFALYVSLYSYFNGDVGALVSWAILRNVVSASLLFYAHTVPFLAKIFSPKEYLYWIIATIAALVVNIILLINTSLPGELIFFLVLLYIGVEGMLLFYAVKYLHEKGIVEKE